MRAAFLPLLLLTACDPAGRLAFTAVNVAALPVFGRTVPDLVVSGVSGRDCSMVRVERGLGYCREAEPPPAPPAFCTRSLGIVDCWAGPEAQPLPARRGLADGPTTLTPEQEAHRTRGWPGLWGN